MMDFSVTVAPASAGSSGFIGSAQISLIGVLTPSPKESCTSLYVNCFCLSGLDLAETLGNAWMAISR